MTKGEKQSFRHFTNQKQLELTDDPHYPAQRLSGDLSTDNRQNITDARSDTMALQAVQANSGMFMHPMHDVTATEQIHGDQVLDALQVELDVLEREMDVGTGERDPNERKSY